MGAEWPLVNGAAIALGSLLGLVGVRWLDEEFRDLSLKAMGLVVLVIGVQMLGPLSRPVNVLLSLVFGAWLGGRWHIDAGLENLGRWAERRVGRGGFSQGFVVASLIFNVGAMAILGSIQAGMGRPATVLLTKSILDGVTAMVLTATLGWGVLGAALVTAAYELTLVLLAHAATQGLPPTVMTDLSASGGVLIAAIGVNFIGGRTVVRVANLLPALLVAVALGWVGVLTHSAYI